MYTFEQFVGYDYHILRKAGMTIRYYRISVGWLEEVTRYSDCGKNETLTVFKNNQDAYDAYRESMQSYGFKRFDISKGNY